MLMNMYRKCRLTGNVIKRERGFTLIEAVLIMVVIGATFFAFGYLFGNLSQEALQTDLTIVAAKLSREKMEEWVGLKADGGALGYQSVVTQAPQTIVVGNWSFARAINVSYVNSADLSPSAVNTGYKKVDVTTSWGADLGESVTLTTLITDVVP